MTYQRTAYHGIPMLTMACDECGTVLDDGEHGMYSTRALIDDVASMEWWQRVETPTGVRHYCPQHWHAVCADCGRRETGDAWVLLQQEGWLDPEGPDGSCPECQRKILEEEELP